MIVSEWLSRLEPGSEHLFGTSAIALSTVARAGIPVSPAFVVSTEAVQAFFLQPSLRAGIEKALRGHELERAELLAGVAKDLRARVQKATLPPELRAELARFYTDLRQHLVLTKEQDLPLTLLTTLEEGGHLRHHGTTKRVADLEKLLKAIFLPLFEPRALQRRLQEKGSILPALPAVTVQYSEPTQAAGTAQVFDPQTHDGTVISVEAHYHGHSRQSHAHATDLYRFDQATLLPLSTEAAKHRYAQDHTGSHRKAGRGVAHETVLSEHEQRLLVRMVKRAQSAFSGLQQFHWVLAEHQIFFTEVIPFLEPAAGPEVSHSEHAPVLIGQSGNLGQVVGVVRTIRTKADQAKLRDGEIAVVRQVAATDRDWLLGVAGLISELGSRTGSESELAISLGVPALTGAAHARETLRDGQLVTLDGTQGAVYVGRVELAEEGPSPAVPVVTGTHLTVTVPDPLTLTGEQLKGWEGVGLIRGEFLLYLLGSHPNHLKDKGLLGEYQEILHELLERVARLAYPRPLTYQLHDISHEHTFMQGGRPQRHEPNPKLGYRGTHRLLNEPELLEVELQVLARLAEQGRRGVRILLPFVRTLQEVQEMERVVREHWPRGAAAPELWVRCETPALTISAEELCHEAVHGVYFDVPALAQLISGIDGENAQLAHHVNQADSAVLDALRYAIATCRAHGVETSLIAEGEELRPEVVEIAVRAGVSEICLDQSELGEMRSLVASIEQRMLLDHLLAEEVVEETK